MRTITIPPGNIDHHLRTYRAPGTRFVLEPGDYTTQGAFAFAEYDLCMLAPNCELIGAGSNRTALRLVDPVTEYGGKPTQYVEVLTGGARTYGASVRLVVSGLFLDCETTEMMPVVGVHLWTSRAAIEDVCVAGVAGCRDWESPVKEGFGILINNSAELPLHHRSDGGHRATRCEVIAWHGRPECYATGIYIGVVQRYGHPMLWSEVSDCRVYAPQGRLHAGYAANACTVIRDCEVHNSVRAVFCDTGSIEHVAIERMRAHNIHWALDLRVAQAGQRREHIAVRDSLFHFGEPTEADGWVQAVLLADESGTFETPIRYVDLERCRFIGPGRGKASTMRLRGNVSAVSVRECQWIGDWQAPVLQDGAKLWEVVS